MISFELHSTFIKNYWFSTQVIWDEKELNEFGFILNS